MANEKFTPLFDSMAQAYGIVTAAVYGRIWRYCRNDSGACFAALDRIANDIGVDRATVSRHISKLVAEGYVQDLTPGRKNHPHTYRLTQKSPDDAISGVAESNSGVAECNTGVAESHMKIQEETNQETKPDANAPARAAIIGVASLSVLGKDVANAASLESESEPKVTVARVDGVTDIFNHATKAKTPATVIRKWKLPAHLEDLCITFAEVFGIEADGPNKTLSNTKQTKGKWLRGATELAELNPTHAELIKARDIARANRYPIAHPGAAVNTITNLRQSARQTKPPVLTHPQPVTFREVTSHDDE